MRWKNPGPTEGVTFVNGAGRRVSGVFRDRSVTLRAEDGTRLRGVLHPGPGLPAPLGFVVGHGFTQHIRKPAVREVLERLSAHGPVLATDFRGHGRSGGRTTVGPNEAMDIDVAVAHLRALGCAQVVTVGFSLGGSVVLRQAALGTPPDAVISVSSPARWFVRDTPAMRRVHWLLEQPHGRLSARLLGVRLAGRWPRVPISPIELATRIDVPQLIVHGAEDHYFPPSDALALSEAGGGEFWLVEGMRHAESSTTPGLVDRIAAWALDTVGPPDRARSGPRRPDRTDRSE
ncbi:serine aminopeptidase S33 family [Saccharopolyspora dendranthemae]|uniref:Serine aminopeptidase S33 family n=1 Tax=Saccharopolyspora dendranthemae TaxID=1181886 RepID=A0A561U620_9PSEU|nr:serine aminopeptidase S33 family [Saccharopolyspora dendranthemae]